MEKVILSKRIMILYHKSEYYSLTAVKLQVLRLMVIGM